MTSLAIERVRVGEMRVSALVRVSPEVPLRTSAVPGLAEVALDLLPGLSRHRCECGSAHGIAAELADTELPHLLEHVALELMALAGSPRDLGGRTSWDFATDGPRVFHVEIGYDDDLVALGALQAGVRVVDGLLGVTGPPDVPAEAERLRALRER